MENLPNHQHGEDPRVENEFINSCLRQKNTMKNQPDHRLRDNPRVENGFMNGIFEQEDEEGIANESKIMVKETRGPTNIWGRAHNLPLLQVEYNELGQPIGGENKERDERVEEDQWVRLLTYWKIEESLKMSERNVDARGKKLMNQRTGKTSFAQIKAKMTKEKGRCPTRVELFNLCFVPSNENPNEVVLSKYSAMQERSNQLTEGSDDAIGPDDIFAQVMGKDGSGHVRMMGQGVCLTDVWSETPRSTSNCLLMAHQAKIAHLQNMLLTQQRSFSSQAKVGQYTSTSNSFSQNATSALPLQVTDFGLARLHDEWESCESNQIVGASWYLAPESFSGGKMTEKVNVYTLSALLLARGSKGYV
ncbi:hypothetical protein C2S52_000586 [Perilla frutescens var. hirtella]|nr:hypothetical protein C2S52_000586 [Perilla frutescens var. hirtella]